MPPRPAASTIPAACMTAPGVYTTIPTAPHDDTGGCARTLLSPLPRSSAYSVVFAAAPDTSPVSALSTALLQRPPGHYKDDRCAAALLAVALIPATALLASSHPCRPTRRPTRRRPVAPPTRDAPSRCRSQAHTAILKLPRTRRRSPIPIISFTMIHGPQSTSVTAAGPHGRRRPSSTLIHPSPCDVGRDSNDDRKPRAIDCNGYSNGAAAMIATWLTPRPQLRPRPRQQQHLAALLTPGLFKPPPPSPRCLSLRFNKRCGLATM